MKDRLIELIQQAYQKCKSTPHCSKCSYVRKDGECFPTLIADHLIANGVIVPPVKVGDKVYKVCTVNSRIKFGDMWDGKVVKSNCDRCAYRCAYCAHIGLRKHEHELMVDVIVEKEVYSLVFLAEIMPYFGKIWFSSKEEAEEVLKNASR